MLTARNRSTGLTHFSTDSWRFHITLLPSPIARKGGLANPSSTRSRRIHAATSAFIRSMPYWTGVRMVGPVAAAGAGGGGGGGR
jgi:hypothetical protein